MADTITGLERRLREIEGNDSSLTEAEEIRRRIGLIHANEEEA